MRAPGFANLRDVAAGLPSGTLVPGVLLRSDAPFSGDPRPALTTWPPAVVIDLRNPEEVDEVHPYTATTQLHPMALLAASGEGEVLTNPLASSPRLAAYLSMTGPGAGKLLTAIVGLVAGASGPALVHCAAGKDRTGIVVGLVLRLLGVPRDEVVAEYLLTEEIRDDLAQRLASRYPLEYGDGAVRAVGPVTFLAGFEAVLTTWDTHEGGTTGWYLANGGTEESLTRLRARLLPRG